MPKKQKKSSVRFGNDSVNLITIGRETQVIQAEKENSLR